MDHKYIQSMLSSDDKCGICKRPLADHSSDAVCECCNNTGNMNIFMTMLMCDECIEKEKALQAESRANSEQRVRDSQLSMKERLENVKHEVLQSTDIFNAKIPSLIDIQRAIDNDSSIPPESKTFVKAQTILELFNHLKSVIIETNKVRENALNLQRASQSELNILASQLRIEERNKLQIQDINYKLGTPRLMKTTNKVPRKMKVKFDMDELNKYAAELNVPNTAIATMASKRGCTVAEAARILKEMLS